MTDEERAILMPHDTFPLPLQGRPERLHLYKWIKEEEIYVAKKFDDERNGRDKSLAEEDLNYWYRQITQYLDRANAFLKAARESQELGTKEEIVREYHLRAQQAMAKAMMTAKGLVESSIRVFGPLPKPGLPSGYIEPNGKK